MGRRLFTVTVFGIPAILNNGEVRIMVNVRKDQEDQWNRIKENPVPDVRFIDCIGGEAHDTDTSLISALANRIKERVGRCLIYPTANLSPPFSLFNDGTSDVAVWVPILLVGKPQLTSEAKEYLWISQHDFENTKFRCPGALDKNSRTGRMMRMAFNFYNERRSLFCEFFSEPEAPFWLIPLKNYLGGSNINKAKHLIVQSMNVDRARKKTLLILKASFSYYEEHLDSVDLKMRRVGPYETLQEIEEIIE